MTLSVSSIPLTIWVGFVGGALLQLQPAGLFAGFFLRLPGTVMHELAHFLSAFLLRANPKGPRLFPTRETDGRYTLGSVSFEARTFSAGLVALAPLYTLPLLMGPLLRWATNQGWPAQLVGGYGLSSLMLSMFPSSADWRIALRYPAGSMLLLSLLSVLLGHELGKV